MSFIQDLQGRGEGSNDSALGKILSTSVLGRRCREEINLPAVLWQRFYYRHHPIYAPKKWWTLPLFVAHTIRVLAFPVWILVAIMILVYNVLWGVGLTMCCAILDVCIR